MDKTVLCTAPVFIAVTLNKVHGQVLPPNGQLPIELRAQVVSGGSAIELVVPKSDTAGVVHLQVANP